MCCLFFPRILQELDVGLFLAGEIGCSVMGSVSFEK